jgi:hypothetical protein
MRTWRFGSDASSGPPEYERSSRNSEAEWVPPNLRHLAEGSFSPGELT